MLKNNPFLLAQTFQKSRSARKPPPPKYLPALTLFPCAPRALTSTDPFVSGAFLPEGYLDGINGIHAKRLRGMRHAKQVVEKAKVFRKVFPIVYEEDKLREMFYDGHVGELGRPVCAIEDDVDETAVKAESGIGSVGENVYKFKGEVNVQHAMFLMSKEGGGLTRFNAYQNALETFYQRAATEERAQKELERKRDEEAGVFAKDGIDANMKVKGLSVGKEAEREMISIPGKPWTESFMRQEALILEESALYASEQNMA